MSSTVCWSWTPELCPHRLTPKGVWAHCAHTSDPCTTLTYGQKTLGLPAYSGFTATLVGGVVLAVFCPLFGHWSDKISRPRIMVVTAWLFVLTSWPCFFLM